MISIFLLTEISPSFGFSNSQNLTKCSTDTKSSSSEVKSTESEVKVQTTEVKSSGFTFGNSFMSSTTTTSTQSMSLGSSVQFGTTFSSSSTVPSFPGFNFKPTTDLQKPSSGFNFKSTTDLQKPSSAFSFGVAKPKEGEGSASQGIILWFVVEVNKQMFVIQLNRPRYNYMIHFRD